MLEAALLDAAWEELQATGYDRLTVEGVAERAHTSRPVLARRWRTRAELVISALRRHRPLLSGEVPDTGSLRGDVLALLRRARDGLREIGPDTIYGLLLDMMADGQLASDLQGEVLNIGAEVIAAILDRAAERGEARRDIHPRVAMLPIALFRHEFLLTRTVPDDRVLREIVDEVFLPLVRSEGAD